jgi:hypothetical protein
MVPVDKKSAAVQYVQDSQGLGDHLLPLGVHPPNSCQVISSSGGAERITFGIPCRPLPPGCENRFPRGLQRHPLHLVDGMAGEGGRFRVFRWSEPEGMAGPEDSQT